MGGAAGGSSAAAAPTPAEAGGTSGGWLGSSGIEVGAADAAGDLGENEGIEGAAQLDGGRGGTWTEAKKAKRQKGEETWGGPNFQSW